MKCSRACKCHRKSVPLHHQTKHRKMKTGTLSKKELSFLYAPELTERGARKRLSAWLQYNPKLIRALERTGYKKQQRLLTPRQVEIVYRYLGEP